jgi:hypothetical protein
LKPERWGVTAVSREITGTKPVTRDNNDYDDDGDDDDDDDDDNNNNNNNLNRSKEHLESKKM